MPTRRSAAQPPEPEDLEAQIVAAERSLYLESIEVARANVKRISGVQGSAEERMVLTKHMLERAVKNVESKEASAEAEEARAAMDRIYSALSRRRPPGR